MENKNLLLMLGIVAVALIVGMVVNNLTGGVTGNAVGDSARVLLKAGGDAKSFHIDEDYKISASVRDTKGYYSFNINGEPTFKLKKGESTQVGSLKFSASKLGSSKYVLLNVEEVEVSGSSSGILSLSLGESLKSYLNGKGYDVELQFVDSDECKFIINGEYTEKIKLGEDTYGKLADGTIIEVTDIDYSTSATEENMKCYFTIDARYVTESTSETTTSASSGNHYIDPLDCNAIDELVETYNSGHMSLNCNEGEVLVDEYATCSGAGVVYYSGFGRYDEYGLFSSKIVTCKLPDGTYQRPSTVLALCCKIKKI